MGDKVTSAPVGKVMFQSFFDCPKCQFLPRNFIFSKQVSFHGFVARIEHIAGQSGAVIQMHLAHAGHAHHGEQVFHDELCAGFFGGFAGCTLGGGFAQLHKACGQGPFAFARLDVAFAQQDLVAQPRHCAHHIERVFVMDCVAGSADGPQFGVAVENISSIEVEDVLYRHPDVLAAAVVAKPDARWGETPCAFVELKAGAQTTPEQIVAHCKRHLAGFKVPRAVVFGELPKTSTGKIQKFELRKQAGSAQAIDV